MTVFFVIAGFFARLMVHRKGVKEFIRNRRQRILYPLLVAWPVIMLLFGMVITWMFYKLGVKPSPPKLSHPPLLLFPWGHLWFLYVLLLLYGALLTLRWLANSVLDRNGRFRGSMDSAIANLLGTPLLVVLLALPLACALYFTPWWNFSIGIPTPDNTLIPNLPAFVGYGTAVTFGWFLHRQMNLLAVMQRLWPIFFVFAVALTALAYWMVGMPSTPITLTTLERLVYCGTYCIAIWCWSFASIGAASKYLSGVSPIRRYLADASYWMYVMHMPIVLALQILVLDWPIHWSFKYALILIVTFAVLLVTYHYWVRSTFIGAALNGRRYARNVGKVS